MPIEQPAAPIRKMSRICVKALGRHHTEEALRKHFSQNGATVTDVKILRHPDGVSRCFGFIGFQKEGDAKKAVKYFNNTYLDTSKMVVELAKPVGDDQLPRPWSKHSKGSSGFDKKNPEEKKEAGEDAGAADKKKDNRSNLSSHAQTLLRQRELLQAVKSGQKEDMTAFVTASKGKKATKVWANDDVALNFAENVKVETAAVKSKKAGGEGIVLTRTHMKFDDDEEDADEIDAIVKANDGGGESDDEYEEMPDEDGKKKKGKKAVAAPAVSAADQPPTAVNDEKVDHLAYLRSKVSSKSVFEEEEEDDDDDSDSDSGGNKKKKTGKKESAKKGANGKVSSSNSKNNNNDSDSSDVDMADADDDDDNESNSSSDDDDNKSDADEKDKDNENGEDNKIADEREKKYGDMQEEMEGVSETGRLFVRNLSYTCNEGDLRQLFSKYGDITDVHLCTDKETKRPTGMAFILFMIPECAVRAMSELDGQIFQGRLIHILPAKSMLPRGMGNIVSTAKTSYKKKQEEKRKADATNSSNWNMLFMRPDAVADAVADDIGVDKAALLDPEAQSSMAVRLALGETHVITDTKAYLEKEGVNLAAFEGSKGRSVDGGRSNSVIIVKNISHRTDVGQIRRLFGKYGDLARVILPPAKTMAIVEFLASDDAKLAFRNLAYRKFLEVPLYLEWAPADALIGGAGAGGNNNNASTSRRDNDNSDNEDGDEKTSAAAAALAKQVAVDEKKKKEKEEAKKKEAVEAKKKKEEEEAKKKAEAAAAASATAGSKRKAGEVAAATPAPAATTATATATPSGKSPVGATLFIKNLNFDTIEDGIKTHFAAVAPVRSAIVMRKRDPKRGPLSLGYGFVEFNTVADAQLALRKLHCSRLDGHEIELKVSNRGQAESGDSGAAEGPRGSGQIKAKGTKIAVRNVPFEATRNELRELFQAFGQVKSVRLPRKFDGSHRGFAFVDFLTKEEAAAAFKAVQNTHLYGRHLVLEWAEENASIEAIREKAAKQMHYLASASHEAVKKRRVQLGEDEDELNPQNDDDSDDDDEEM